MKKFTASSKSLAPDPRFKSGLVSKFVNCMMWQGKKSVSLGIFYDAMDIIQKKLSKDPLEVFKQAIENVKPLIEVRSKRVGGATYQVPIEVSSRRQQSLAIRWVLDSARGKKGKPMCEKLAQEFMDAYGKQGGAYTTRENVHKMAEANKAFAHFAW